MNLNQLRFARAVVEAGTFTRAAERCYVTQSTLSTGIALLEKELGERLFVRTTRSVTLTSFGRRLLPFVDRVLEAQLALVEGAKAYLEPDVDLVRIGVCPLVDMMRLEAVMAPYRQANRTVRVVLEQLNGLQARKALEEGRLDFVVVPSQPRRSKLERSKLYDDALVYLPSGAIGPSGTGHRPVRVEEIAGDEFLLVHDACGLTCGIRELFRSRRIVLREYTGQAVSYQVLEEWARVGVASAILPRSKLSSSDLGRPIVHGNGHPAVIRYEVVWSPSAAGAPHLQALVQHLKNAGGLLARGQQGQWAPAGAAPNPVRTNGCRGGSSEAGGADG